MTYDANSIVLTWPRSQPMAPLEMPVSARCSSRSSDGCRTSLEWVRCQKVRPSETRPGRYSTGSRVCRVEVFCCWASVFREERNMERSDNPYQSPDAQSAAPKIALKTGQVRIRLRHRLPHVCSLCGAPAALKRAVEFRGRWSMLPWFGALEDPVSVSLPLCRKHRFYRWGWPITPQILVFLFMLLVMLLPWLLIRFKQHAAITLAGVAVLLLVGSGGLVWLVVQSLRIRASLVTPREAILSGVAPDFARACEEMYELETQQTKEEIDSFLG
jgi:hypothetical protein